MVVPGSQQVKAQAQAEGLDQIFRDAGADWREAGCSMCIAMNGDQLQPGEYSVSTSNRNFEGRQGKGGADVPGEPADRGGVGDHRRGDRRKGAAVMEKFTAVRKPHGPARASTTSIPTRSSRRDS